MTQAIQQIPLSKLVPSPDNVRQSGRKDGIKQLAASIKAHGLLQNLTVKRAGKGFEVIAGGRRLTALQSLAAKKELPKNAPIPCKVIEADDNAIELSLAENVGQVPMHPADQYEAFAALHTDEGMSAEDIASRFGVSVVLVKQRLLLGAVSPKLIKLYRKGDLNLDQLTAFAITDDHKKQERVWKELTFNNSRAAILRALSEGQVPSDDRRAIFVGAKAYQQAGGAIIRDLFDEDDGGYFTNADLLNGMVREKLQSIAAPVLAEGWKWVVVEQEFDYDLTRSMRRVRPEPILLSDADQAKLDELEAAYTELAESDGEYSESEELQRLEREITALTGEPVFQPVDIAIAGAFVSLGADGMPQIERGFIRPEDYKPAVAENAKDETAADGSAPDEGKPLSAVLIAELTATRTLFLRDALSHQPGMALIAVTHALAANTFYPHEVLSCLEISQRSASLGTHAAGIDETDEAKAIRAKHETWAQELPDDPANLWESISKLSDARRLELLAHCAAMTINAMRLPHARETAAWAHADAIAQATGLDMVTHWQPTAANYLGRVSKERVLEAVREGVSDLDAARISSMKKQDMAAAAERLLAGKGWLPEVLR